MKLYVGQKVVIKNIPRNQWLNHPYVSSEMEKYFGKIVTIDDLRSYRIMEDKGRFLWSYNIFYIKEDGHRFMWADWMVEENCSME